jgi:hypothetical protein
VRLYAGPKPLEAHSSGDELPIDGAEVPPDGEARVVRLTARSPGLHRVWVDDGGDATEVLFPVGLARTLEMSARSTPSSPGERSGYFYVPQGTTRVGGYSAGKGAIHDPAGKRVLEFGPVGEFFEVPVRVGDDGKLWSLRHCRGRVAFMTVPPFIASTMEKLLLPETVVEADLNRANE